MKKSGRKRPIEGRKKIVLVGQRTRQAAEWKDHRPTNNKPNWPGWKVFCSDGHPLTLPFGLFSTYSYPFILCPFSPPHSEEEGRRGQNDERSSREEYWTQGLFHPHPFSFLPFFERKATRTSLPSIIGE
jgi:hypothetical protein